ncbi:MAG: glycosyltransferase [Anaerolineales bacterium]|nr:glycosyltransferase [Anaerolineales bacterium]
MNNCTSGSIYTGRVGLQQRVLPSYRVPFFDHLADTCPGGLSVFTGEPRSDESIMSTMDLQRAALTRAENRHFLRGKAYLCRQPNILNWLEDWDPDVLILEANPRYPDNWRAQRWMRNRNRPVIGWGLGAVSAAGLTGVLRRAVRSGYLGQFDALITYSTHGAELYRAANFPPDRIFVAPNAVVSRSGKPAARRDEEKKEPVVLFVGRLQARKRIDVLLRVCADISQPMQLWVVGDGPERAGLEALAAEMFPSAHFFGTRQGVELDELFSRADLFVLPGTGGLAVQQAMAAGLPVIVAEGDGTQQDLVSPANGWLVPARDTLALQMALEEALSNRARLRIMGSESLKIVRDSVNIETMVEVFHAAMCSAGRMER